MVKKITPLGDLHNGRQTRLVETDTSQYIEKPRDYKTEAAFLLFCDRFAELGVGAFADVPASITTGEDSHTEEIVENLPTTPEGIALYYRRAGILAFVCYLLASADMHCENLIARGDMPVLVDLETLLTGRIARSSSLYNLSQSVVSPHLLCSFAHRDMICDVSGFTGSASDWKNIPHTMQGREFLWNYVDVFLDGFTCAYQTAMRFRKETEQLIHVFDNCLFRQILRPTQTYDALVRYISSFPPELRREKAVELLSRAYKKDIDRDRLKKARDVIDAEVHAVCEGWIPLFHAKGNGTQLLADGTKVMEGYLSLSPVENAVKRLYDLSEADLSRQRKICTLAITASTPLKENRQIYIRNDALAPGETAAKIVSDCAVEHLPSVFCELSSDANGAISFVSAGFSLYSGLIGILCMYAALYRKTGKARYRSTLMKYYESFAEVILIDSHPIHLANRNVSLGDGIAGMLAGMLHIGELTGNDQFRRDAQSLIDRLVLSEPLTNADYLNGAGALPVILQKCESENGDRLFADLAVSLADAQPYTTGAAHGAAGLLLAFLTIYKKNCTRTLEKAVHSMVQWEEEKYSVEEGNWQDLRESSRIGFMSGWCSGAPGIGMTRQAAKQFTDDPILLQALERDIDRAKSFLERQTVSKRDSLCCGTASRLMAASYLGIRVDRLYASLAESEAQGNFRLIHPAETWDLNVSLMQGISGVAYALAMYGDPLSGGMLL